MLSKKFLLTSIVTIAAVLYCETGIVFAADNGKKNPENEQINPEQIGSCHIENGAMRFGSHQVITNILMDSPKKARSAIVFNTQGQTNWTVGANNAEQQGYNSGRKFELDSYSDSGTFLGTALQVNRSSGIYGAGGPLISILAPFRQINPSATIPNGVIGNDQEWGRASDRQPKYVLPKDPIQISGTNTAIVHWPKCCAEGSELNHGSDAYVYLDGVSAVGGAQIQGWYDVATKNIVDANHFKIILRKSATASTGGGDQGTVRPSFTTTVNKVFSTVTTGAPGFAVQHMATFTANPEFPSVSSYEREFTWSFTPNDNSTTDTWSLADHEADYTNRGPDMGYSPNIYVDRHATVGVWAGPKSYVLAEYPGGGIGRNWNTVFSCFQGSNRQGVVGIYDCLSNQPNSLVGAEQDPKGHGGVGYDSFGAYTPLPEDAFKTFRGSSEVKIKLPHNWAYDVANGQSVYIPNTYRISGVEFGKGAYVISNVNTEENSLEIRGKGVALANAVGGGKGQWVSFKSFVPYASVQAWGAFDHGAFKTAPGSFYSADGLAFETDPGNGFGWTESDGTAATASISSRETHPGNLDITLTPAGGGIVLSKFGSGQTGPSSKDIPPGYCADWNNLAEAKISRYCDIGGKIERE